MRINGININYYDKGAGDAVFFLHGWGADFLSFARFLDDIAGYYRAVALDLPGFGGSDEPPCGWSVDDYADFVADFLAELGISDVILIGHSFGGRIIIKLAARQGERLRIKKIILIDSAGVPPHKTLRKRARAKIYRLVKAVFSINAIERRYPRLLERWRYKNSSADYRNATPVMRECLVKAVNEDLTPYMPSISCPTLLVWGENDTATPIGDGRTMEKLIRGSGLVILQNAGHYSFLDQSYTFGRVLDSFLNIRRQS
jgi:pimeloyl-ACP methyl ester carboxylesterase